MRARPAFLLAVAFFFAALATGLVARSQLAFAMRKEFNQELLREYAQRGTWLLYASWILAVGGLESLLRCKQLERGLSCAVLFLICVFIYLNFAIS